MRSSSRTGCSETPELSGCGAGGSASSVEHPQGGRVCPSPPAGQGRLRNVNKAPEEQQPDRAGEPRLRLRARLPAAGRQVPQRQPPPSPMGPSTPGAAGLSISSEASEHRPGQPQRFSARWQVLAARKAFCLGTRQIKQVLRKEKI